MKIKKVKTTFFETTKGIRFTTLKDAMVRERQQAITSFLERELDATYADIYDVAEVILENLESFQKLLGTPIEVSSRIVDESEEDDD